MINVLEGLKRPFSAPQKLLGFLTKIIFIVSFIGTGYQLECARTAMAGQFQLPEWKNFWQLFKRGFFAEVIKFIYHIPMFVLTIYLMMKIFPLMGAMSNPETFLASSAEYLPIIQSTQSLIIVLIIVNLIVAWLWPMAIVRYAWTGKFSSAFNIGAIISKTASVNYVVAWLVSAVYYAALYVLSIWINSIMQNLWLMILLQTFFFFVAGITMMTLIGKTYAVSEQTRTTKALSTEV